MVWKARKPEGPDATWYKWLTKEELEEVGQLDERLAKLRRDASALVARRRLMADKANSRRNRAR